MNSICSYIQWATLAGLELKFTPSENDLNYCSALGDSKQYTVSYGLDELWRTSAYQFLNKLREMSLTLEENQIASHLRKRVGFLQAMPEDRQVRKFTHYAAHAETLSQFFDGLGLHQKGRSFPSSAIIFEFLKQSGTGLSVRLNYYDGETQEESVLRIPG